MDLEDLSNLGGELGEERVAGLETGEQGVGEWRWGRGWRRKRKRRVPNARNATTPMTGPAMTLMSVRFVSEERDRLKLNL